MIEDDEPICRICNEPLEDASDGFGTLVHLPETEPHDHEPDPERLVIPKVLCGYCRTRPSVEGGPCVQCYEDRAPLWEAYHYAGGPEPEIIPPVYVGDDGTEIHPECLRFGYIQDGRCCGHAPEED